MRHADAYRTDIDGLRAFAVLFVTIFHINEALIPGGFVGVDMFFVISGFLITGIIVRDRANGVFSFAEFYRRRIRRIFPAMFLVTAVTFVAGLLLLLPEDVAPLSWSVLATILSGANIYFTYFLDTSYFAPDSATVPLLHMWSLGVEEQFYLFWPAFLLVLMRWPRLVVPALLALSVASVALGEWLLGQGAFEWAYYMLPTRAFQLALGGLLVFVLPWFAMGGRVALILAVAGLALCFGSAAFLTAETLYPGLNAVPVTIGTALLLAAGTVANPVGRMLSVQPLRWIGQISYSLYLWHWPVLAYQRYLMGELSPAQQVGSLVLMLALATLSYRYVEQPARRSQEGLPRVAFKYLAVPASAIVAVMAVPLYNMGFGATASAMPQMARASSAPYVCQMSLVTAGLLRESRCIIGTEEEPSILLWGDSNAGHYVGALRSVAGELGFGFRNIAHSACPPILRRPERFAQERFRALCQESAEAMAHSLSDYDVVIISAAWDTYVGKHGDEFLRGLSQTVRRLVRQGKTVMLLGRVPRLSGFDGACERKRLKLPWLICHTAQTHIRRTEEINAQIRQIATRNRALYADFTAVLCEEGRCDARIGDEVVYLDPGHLSLTGSEAVGRAVLARPELLEPFRQLISQR